MANDNNPSDPKQDDDAWIERVVNIAGGLGFNKMRLRWKLIRWQDHRRKKARHRAQVVAHITYAHKICHECGAVQDKDEAVCTRCGVKLGRRGFQVLERIGLAMPVPISMSTLLAIAVLGAYARVWVAGGGGLSAPSGSLLIGFGGRWPPAMSDEPWRLVTSMFLHAGLLHLAFNILAIASVGPRIEELYGRTTMLGLFIVTGVLANLGALQVGQFAIGIGASGGVMGLIGAAAGAGHRAGTGSGRALRDSMLKWSAYTFFFGFAAGADNWAHLFGAVAGAAFGLLIRPEAWTRRALLPVRAAVGFVGLVATIGAVAIIVTRTPPPPAETPEDPDIAIDQPQE
jgi:rhomboid protease GluP